MGVRVDSDIRRASEQLTASRIQLTASRRQVLRAARYLRPRRARLARARVPYAGATRFEVPAGKLQIDAVKGFEFLPEQADVEVKPGEVTFVTLKLGA